jgi:hypothetical protein
VLQQRLSGIGVKGILAHEIRRSLVEENRRQSEDGDQSEE